MKRNLNIKTQAVVLGTITLTAQILLSRAILGVFYGNELLLGMTLGLWLIGSGAGAWSGNARFIKIREYRNGLFHIVLTFFLFWTILGLVASRMIRWFLAIPPGEYIGTGGFLFYAIPALLPAGFAAGLGFSLLAQEYGKTFARDRNPASVIYVLEAAGSVVGGLFVTLIAAQFISPLTLLSLLLVSVLFMTVFPNKRQWWKFALTGVAAAALLLCSSTVDRWQMKQYWASMAPGITFIEGKTSRYGELAVVDWAGEKYLFHNSIKCTALPDSLTAQRLAALTVNQHNAPQKVLLISGGLGGLAPELARYPLERVDYVEIDQKAFQLSMDHLAAPMRCEWGRSNLHVHFSDGRRFLSRSSEAYDIILLNAGKPSSAWSNRYYTEEFFELVHERLAPNGLFAICDFPSGENYLGRELLSLNAAIYHGLQKSFACVAVLPGDEAIFLASVNPGGLFLDPRVLAQRHLQKKLSPPRFHPALFAHYLPAERRRFIEHLLDETTVTRRNRDDHPIAYYIDLTLWHKMTGGAGKVLRAMAGISFAVFFMVWFIFFGIAGLALANKHLPERSILLWNSALLGQTGMVLQILFIFNLQNIFGYLYEGIAAATAAFMAGIAAAGWIGQFLPQGKLFRSLKGLLLLNAAAPPTLALFFRLLHNQECGLLFYPGIVVAGGLTGIGFSILSRLYEERGGNARWGSIYAADLLGGAFGAFCFSAFFIPLFGFAGSCALIAVANLMAFLIVALRNRSLEMEIPSSAAR